MIEFGAQIDCAHNNSISYDQGETGAISPSQRRIRACRCSAYDGASVSLIIRELKTNTNQVFSWRKRFGVKPFVSDNATSIVDPESETMV